MQRTDLEGLTREELLARAEKLGVARASSLTKAELVDAILSATARPSEPPKARGGWFGRARDLLTSVIDRGLHLPESRGRRSDGRATPAVPPPLPTVTLAEIYAAQGHLDRAITTLDEVLAREPEHKEAKRLHERFSEQLRRTKPSTPPPVVEAKLEPMSPPASASPAPVEVSSTPERPEPEAAVAPAPTTAEVASAPVVPMDAAAPAEEGATVADRAEEGPSDEPSALLDEQTYEIDEVVALAVDPSTVYLYWEVRPQTLASARAERPEGALVVRVLEAVPTERGVVTEVRDTRVDALFGELFVRGLRPSTHVRVSIGWRSGSDYEPFAVGDELATPRALPTATVAETYRRWSDAGGPIAAQDEAILEVFGADRALDGERAPERRDEDDLLARFPAGVWIDPRGRMVHVVDRVGGSWWEAERRATHEHLERLPGSSHLIRRESAWSLTTRESVWSYSSHAPVLAP